MTGNSTDFFETLTNLGLDVIKNVKKPTVVFEEMLKMASENEDVCSMLLDVLILVETEIEILEEKMKTTAKESFVALVGLITNTLIPGEILKAELQCSDISTVEFQRQFVRTKTRLYFKQAKFNLLREESEGYSKLITELLEAENHTSIDSENYAKIVKNRILSLIGQFNLDPNRVTDMVLECFENCPKQRHFFVSLLKEINAVQEYVCAILGFKYTFYQGANKKTPYSLYVLTAALIQHGMLDMMKILAFMVPKTEEIKMGHRERMQNAQERSSKAETISTASIPIITDSRSLDDNVGSTSTTSTISFTTVTQVQEDDDAKLAEKFTEDYILSTNQKLGLACALLEFENWKQAQILMDRLPEFYAVQASPRICRSLCRIIEKAIDEFYKLNCVKSVFAESLKTRRESEDEFPENGIKKIESWNELGELSGVLWYLGPRIAYRATTDVKLLRLLVVYFQKEQNGEVEKNEKLSRLFVDITAECILPSLTLSETNVALSEEIWQLMQLFPYTWRYWMYSKWNQETNRNPELMIMRGKIHGRTKYVLKRLSKETVKMMGRQLGKLCHIHPTTVLSYLLSQVQTFDNLIGPVVDGLRFLTSLEFDILTYCIISQLADPSKQALKSSDATISPWLQALGTLVGSLYRRYPLELSGMLDYVQNQLKCCKSFDLLLLREIIQNMSWIETSTTATNEQIEALGGGELLRQEAGGYSNAKNKRAASRLRDTLMKGDLAVGLCILIAQQKDYIGYNESDNLPLKLVGEMVDQCSLTLQQLSAFLVSYLKTDEYSRRFPSVREFITDYSLKIEAAMCLTRPTFLPRIMEIYDGEKRKLRAELPVGEDGQKQRLDAVQKTALFSSAFEAKVEELSTDFKESKLDIERIPSKIFTVFWMLGNYDIEVPVAAYDRTIEGLKKQSKDDDHTKTRRAEERAKQLEGKLREEQKRQNEHVERIKAWLDLVKETLFEDTNPLPVCESFLQLCIFPRALFSEQDAVFCGSFYILLHEMKTPGFQTLITMDRIFENILPLIAGLTENETNSLSRFLEILLSRAVRWNSSEEIFKQECFEFPGMVTKKAEINWPFYRRVVYRWQGKLVKTFSAVLEKDSVEYVIIRNCLILMTKLTPCFPLLDHGVKTMEEVATKVRDREKGKRDDLSLKAASYVGRLKMRNVKVFNAFTFAGLILKKKETPTPPPIKPKTTAEGSKKVVKQANESNGEPAGKRSKTNQETVEKNGEEVKKKRPAKTEIYVPKKVADKEKKGGEEVPEDGEVTTPSPPPNKKSRLSDRVKESSTANEVEKKRIREKSAEKSREKKRNEPEKEDRKSSEKDKKKEKENGSEIVKKERESHKSKERSEKKRESINEREIAGPTMPEALSRQVSKEEPKVTVRKLESKSLSSSRKEKEEKNKDRKREDGAKSPSRNRDRVRQRTVR